MSRREQAILFCSNIAINQLGKKQIDNQQYRKSSETRCDPEKALTNLVKNNDIMINLVIGLHRPALRSYRKQTLMIPVQTTSWDNPRGTLNLVVL